MAKKSESQINLEYFVANGILITFGILPRRLAIFVGVWLGRICYLIFGKLRRIGMINTGVAFPEKSEKERKRLVRGCFESLGRQLGEISQFPKATEESLLELVDFEDEANKRKQYDEFKRQNRGVIFLTPHFGGWEILAFASSAKIGPQSYLVRPLDNPKIDTKVAALRGRFGNRPIGKTNSVLKILRFLREGGNLGVLPDLNAQAHEGVFVPFFGKMACTTAGVAALAKRTNSVALVAGAGWDHKKKKYVAHFGEPIEFESTGNREDDVRNYTARYTADIEKLIRMSPDQWLWIHKRWQTRPDGEDSIYS